MTAYDVRCIGQDPAQLEAFYREHLPDVRTFVARRVGDPHTAADLTADVFLAAIDASPRYRSERGSPGAWLAGIARNVLAGEVRRRSREHRALRRIAGRRSLDDGSLARIAERIDAERETRRIYLAMEQLPQRDRLLLERVAVDGLSVASAARELGLSAGTARVRLHRARRSLDSFLRPTPLSPATEAPR